MENWYYHQPGSGRAGPLSAEKLREYFSAGRVSRDTLVWREGMSEWQPLEKVSGELDIGPDQLYAPAPAAPPPLPPGFNAAPAPAASPMYTRAPSASYAAPQSQSYVAPPPKKGMSGCLIAVIVAAVLAVPVIAILAAISIPAYQQYVLRSKVTTAMSEAAALKLQITEFQAQHSQCPSNGLGGFKNDAQYASQHISSITVGRFDSGQCGMEVRVTGTGSDKVDGKAIWFEYDGDSWECTSEIEDPLLPANCRG